MDDEKFRIIIDAEDRTKGALSNVHSSLSKIGMIAGGAAIAGIGASLAAIGAGFKYSLDQAMEAQEVMAQTNAVLESTGGIAGVSADMVSNLANQLMGVTRFSDETIQSGENLLLTFTNIGKETFPLATQTMLDMSQALGQDLQASAIQLGKALQDPIQGVGALRRVGVNFTDSQKALIESLVESGKLEEAQALILKELQTEFGGSAEAAGKTFAGQLDILKNSLSNVGEEAGNVLLPALTEVFTELSPMLLGLANDLAEFVKSEEFKQWIQDVVKWIKEDLIPGIIEAAAWFKNDFMPAFRDFWAVAGPILGFLAKAFALLWKVELVGLKAAFETIQRSISSFVTAFQIAKDAVIRITDAISTIIERIQTAFSRVFGKVKEIVDNAKTYIENRDWLGLGRAIIEGIARGVGQFAHLLFDAAIQAATGALAAIKRVLGISSPSKVFEKEVGENIGLGMLQGINRSLNTASTAASISPILPGASAVASGARGGSIQIFFNAPVIGFEDEYALADKLASILSKHKR